MSNYKTVNANWHTFMIGGVSLASDLASAPPTLILDGDVLGIRTGVAMGPVRVTIDVLNHHPPIPAGGWEDITEVSVVVSDSVSVYGPWDDTPAHALSMSPGDFRLRVSAVGRSFAYDLSVDEPTEQYSLELWPAPRSIAAAVKVTSSDLSE